MAQNPELEKALSRFERKKHDANEAIERAKKLTEQSALQDGLTDAIRSAVDAGIGHLEDSKDIAKEVVGLNPLGAPSLEPFIAQTNAQIEALRALRP